MRRHRQDGANAPGPVTPTKDKGPTVAAVAPQESNHDESHDYLPKRIATAQARAALIGLVLEALENGAWCLTYPAFGSAGHVCTVSSLDAAEATLCAFETIRADVLETIKRMRAGR